MARPAKSLEEHRLHGTVPQTKAATESYVKSGRPKFPKGITPEQKNTFKRIVGLLSQRRTVTSGDAELIYQYSVLADLWQQAMEEIRTGGIICSYKRTDNHGKTFTVRKKNEACGVADSCQRQMFAILKELGLSPRSRDFVKPTSANPGEQIIPGSMADLYGANLEGLRNLQPRTAVVPVPPIEEEL